LAVVRAANLRVRAQNHHEVTFTAAGFLASEELAGLAQEFQTLRFDRIEMEYGWKGRASPGDVEKALSRVRLLLVQRTALQREITPPS
jgi:hypothetical protein